MMIVVKVKISKITEGLLENVLGEEYQAFLETLKQTDPHADLKNVIKKYYPEVDKKYIIQCRATTSTKHDEYDTCLCVRRR